MTGNRARTWLARYAVAWGYLGGFLLAGLACAALPQPAATACCGGPAPMW